MQEQKGISKDLLSLSLNSLTGHCTHVVNGKQISPFVTEYDEYSDMLGAKIKDVKVYVVQNIAGEAVAVKHWFGARKDGKEPEKSYDYIVLAQSLEQIGEPGHRAMYTAYVCLNVELNRLEKIMLTEEKHEH